MEGTIELTVVKEYKLSPKARPIDNENINDQND